MRLFFLVASIVGFVGSPCRGAGGEYFLLRIALRDVVNGPLGGLTGVRVQMTQFPSGKTAMSGEAAAAAEEGGSHEVKLRKGDRYSADSAAIEAQTWQIAIEAPGYKRQFLGPLLLHAEGDRIVPTENGQAMTATLLRNGQAWRAQFACHTQPAADQLPEAARKLRYILAGKNDCEIDGPQEVFLQVRRPLVRNLFGKPASIGIGTLSGSDFHQLGSEKQQRQAERARAALLNIAHALDTRAGEGCSTGAQPVWLDWVERILLISEERVIAKVSRRLYDAVRELEQNTPAYACQLTVKASAALHSFNDPVIWKTLKIVRAASILHSIKTPVCQGNVQITVGKFQTVDGEVVLADFDIDENFSKGAHFGDVIFHAGTGRGTDPYEVYEMLLARGRHKPKDMGYTLVRLGSDVEQCTEPGRQTFTSDGTAASPN
jgi:hypothetical protein